MPIIYALEPTLTADEFRELLIASTLGERRPIDDLPRLEHMLRSAQIVVTARDTSLQPARLVGVSRAITDFSFCCYLSDLAVDQAYQRQGIGKRLIDETHIHAGPQATLFLIAAPAAESYYPRIGMQQVRSCWQLPRTN